MTSEELDKKIRELELELNYLKSCKLAGVPPVDFVEKPHYSISELLDTNQLQDLMNDFYSLVGLGMSVTDHENEVVVATGWQDVCTKFHRVHPETCKKCKESDSYIIKMRNVTQPIEYKCQNGMWDIACPITIDGEILAGVFFGQFFYDDEAIDYGFFEKQAELYGFDKKAYIESLGRVPVVSRRRVKTLISFYTKLAQLIANLGYQNLITKREQIQERIIAERKLIKSEELYKKLFEFSGAGMLIIDIEGTCLMVNDRAASKFGLSVSQIVGKTISDIMPDETAKKYIELNKQLIESGGQRVYEDTFVIQGEQKTFSIIDVCLQNEDGENYAILSSSVDITDRKQAELELHASQNFLNSVFEHSPISKWISDEHGTLIRINQACREVMQLQNCEVVGKYNIFKDNIVESQGFMPMVRSVFEKGTNERFTIEYDTAAVEGVSLEKTVKLYLNVSISPIINSEGKITNAIIQHIDITERVLAEQALKESEEKYRLLFDTMTEGVALNEMVSDENGEMIDYRVLEVNQAFYHTADYRTKQVVNNVATKLYGMTSEQIHAFWESHKEKNTSAYSEMLSPLNNRCFYISTSPFVNNKFVTVFFDITERKRAEQALRESEFALNDVQQKTGLGLWTFDPVLQHSIWSKEMFNIWGLDPELGPFPYDLHQKYIHPEDYPGFDKAVKEALGIGKPYVLELRICRPDETVRTIVSICEPQIDNQGKVVKLKGTNQDITERKLIELKIKQQNEELTILNSDKDRFISILAHDLRNPFSSILGFLELLTTNMHNYEIATIEKYVNIIDDSARSTYDLLEDTLLWARAQSGKLSFEIKKINFSLIYGDVIEALLLTAQNKNIEINHFFEDEFTVFADMNMIKTILRNLISNALKFTNRNGRIDVYGEQSKSDAIITVSDNGVGIKPEALKKLFGISYETSNEGTAREKGTGLGLLLCKEFVERHGGRIWVESIVGKGSKFKFTLPMHGGSSGER